MEKAKDFTPIIEGIQVTLEEWGYKFLVISYLRTENSLSEKITGAKDFLSSLNFLQKF
ncbi:MAG: hypothetical protein QME57_01785 [Patescibacteria group bacterium]|nr:hypothetical protein [Patescibacteria group bacterium]